MGNSESTKLLGQHLRSLRNDEVYCQDDAAQAANIKKIYDLLDLDNNGYIDKSEIDKMWDSFKKAFKGAAEKEPDLLKDLKRLDDFDFKQMEALDYNKDGKFDLQEFTAMVDYMYTRLSQ
eukprot:TRINITY_DN87574_c0_g1_i1.p2 TRINITY_DN87574_c0_g1~~TRINITY_DN87574_c0_g1_i1.p2  ORF type:complete len:120 (-),score=21.99 TRINITY_DN87574_c0_g1_i1:143-502(-)